MRMRTRSQRMAALQLGTSGRLARCARSSNQPRKIRASTKLSYNEMCADNRLSGVVSGVVVAEAEPRAAGGQQESAEGVDGEWRQRITSQINCPSRSYRHCSCLRRFCKAAAHNTCSL